MRYLALLLIGLSLVGCFKSDPPALPPELQGGSNPLNTLPPVSSDPLAAFPPVVTPEPTKTPTTEPAETTTDVLVVEQNANQADNCVAIVEDLETSFSDMNFCDTDSDCAFAEGSCPFGCYLFHNKALKFADYQPTLETYRADCTPCEYKCASPPRASNIRCREGRCVDTRYDS